MTDLTLTAPTETQSATWISTIKTAPAAAPEPAVAPAAPRAGRIVHYVLQGEAESHGQHRPGIITQANPDGTASIHVFTEDTDGGRYAHGHYFAHFAQQDETDKAAGTWHWPERD